MPQGADLRAKEAEAKVQVLTNQAAAAAADFQRARILAARDQKVVERTPAPVPRQRHCIVCIARVCVCVVGGVLPHGLGGHLHPAS